MAEETKAVEKVETTTTEEGGGNTSSNGKREYNHTPVEELYDLSKPIPRVEKPSKEGHEEEMAAVDAEIDKLRAEKDKVQDKIENFMKTLRGTEVGKEKSALQDLRKQKRALIDQKKAIRGRLDMMRYQSDKLFHDQKQAKASIRFTSIESIDAEIKKLQKLQETTSMSLGEEKKLIKEIGLLQSSKPIAAQLKTKETNLLDVKEQRKQINAELSAKDKEIDAVQKIIDEKSSALDDLTKNETDNRDQKKNLILERDTLRKKVDEKYQEKSTIRQEFREKNNEWYNYKRAIQAQKKVQYEEDKKKRDEEHQVYLKKLEEEELKKIPYEEEMALCDYLTDYLTKTYLSDEKAKKMEEKKSDVVPVKDDPFAGFKPMKKNDDEVFLKMGATKKSRQRVAKKEKKVKKKAPFTLNVDSFEQFGLLNLTPPTKLEMVEDSVEQLKAKKKWYSEQPRGSVPTATDIRKSNEKAASQVRGNKKSKAATGASLTQGKGKGAFSLTKDDFVPLGDASSGRVAVNSTWGQKSPNEPVNEVDEAEVDVGADALG